MKKRSLTALGMAVVVVAAVAGSASSSTIGRNAEDPVTAANPATLGNGAGVVVQRLPADCPFKMSNWKCPQKAATPAVLRITAADVAKARKSKWRIGIVMQTMDIPWSQITVRGMQDGLKKYGIQLAGLADPKFDGVKQASQIQTMIRIKPNAIISIPVDNTTSAQAYQKVGQAGIKLIMLAQVPKGLTYPKGYQTNIEPDDFGSGLNSARILNKSIPHGGTLGIVGFNQGNFYTTDMRQEGVEQWFAQHRPDVKIKKVNFLDPQKAGDVAANFVTANPDVSALWVAWSDPAMLVISALRQIGKNLPVTGDVLTEESGVEIARGDGVMLGQSTQTMYAYGRWLVDAAVLAMLGKKMPATIIMPSPVVTAKNVLAMYSSVWHTRPTPQLVSACNANEYCRTGAANKPYLK